MGSKELDRLIILKWDNRGQNVWTIMIGGSRGGSRLMRRFRNIAMYILEGEKRWYKTI